MVDPQKAYDDKVADLKFQLTFESETLDWDYFIQTAIECKNMQEEWQYNH